MDRLKIFRRITVWTVVVSLSIAALTGIVVILSGSSGDLEARVMGTTSVVGLFGILVLCDLATLGRRFRWVGLIGMPVAAVAFVLWLLQVWAPYDVSTPELFWRSLLVSTLFAVAFAHASLIVQLIDRPQPIVRWLVAGTLATIGAYAAMSAFALINDTIPLGDAYWRMLWVVVILCVLGTVVSPVIGAILKPRGAATVRVVLDLPSELVARIDAVGPRDAVVADTLRQAFPAPASARVDVE